MFFRQTVHHHCRLEAEDNFERMPGEIYCGKKPKAPEEVNFRLRLLLGFNVWSIYRAWSDLSSFTGQLVVLDSTGLWSGLSYVIILAKISFSLQIITNCDNMPLYRHRTKWWISHNNDPILNVT